MSSCKQSYQFISFLQESVNFPSWYDGCQKEHLSLMTLITFFSSLILSVIHACFIHLQTYLAGIHECVCLPLPPVPHIMMKLQHIAWRLGAVTLGMADHGWCEDIVPGDNETQNKFDSAAYTYIFPSKWSLYSLYQAKCSAEYYA